MAATARSRSWSGDGYGHPQTREHVGAVKVEGLIGRRWMSAAHVPDAVAFHQDMLISLDFRRCGVDDMTAHEEQTHILSSRWSATSPPALKTSSSMRKCWISSKGLC